MNLTWKTCLVAAFAVAGLTPSSSAVEELAAPANAIADEVIVEEGIPDSPYDVVPYELDPAVPLHANVHANVYANGLPIDGDLPAEGVTVQSPAYQPSVAWPAPHLHAPAAACCVPPKIRYWNHPLLATDVCPCDCDETIETHLAVPCQCCPVMVKVCVPVCCLGVPQCDASRDLLGRKNYVFCWPCGYQIRIVDRHTGTLVVHTFNP